MSVLLNACFENNVIYFSGGQPGLKIYQSFLRKDQIIFVGFSRVRQMIGRPEESSSTVCQPLINALCHVPGREFLRPTLTC